MIDKPKGWTSFDAVNYVRKIVARTEGKKPSSVKVGHAGTLDPLATGLLILLIGKNYTRRAGELAKLDKTYEVEMTLGATSTTGDEEGEKTKVSDCQPALAEIERATQKFTGKINQKPPAYSAIKINGHRAYELARKGETPAIKARQVTIYESRLNGYKYPKITFTTKVSSGTYIRSLVEGIGEDLKTGAYTTKLRRVSVGQFSVDQAADLHEKNLLAKLEPLIGPKYPS